MFLLQVSQIKKVDLVIGGVLNNSLVRYASNLLSIVPTQNKIIPNYIEFTIFNILCKHVP